MSQEYNKVVWQDETTSQQGTLINAERLDQMQTAHHYADGFEEVDTAPTADPGVDYHKVVYCTADSTFYRWDGAQWQKDVDDDTKALLLAHEADHANPHVVTKAQVGLGNCDNTSDLDKPISTAMATALATKADNDKVVHNTGNEDVLGVKKHFSQILRSAGTLGEVFNYTVLGGTASGGEKMWELKGESRADGTASINLNSRKSDGTYETIVLGDGQGSSSNKVVTAGEMSTALSAKADTATTLAGYGITDAYTKTEADTLLGAKANDNAVVKLSGAQTIMGLKTFTTDIYLQKNLARYKCKNPDVVRGTLPTATVSVGGLHGLNNDNDTLMDLAHFLDTAGRGRIEVKVKDYNAANEQVLKLFTDGYMTGPDRGYNSGSAYIHDVATIGTLDAYTPMVRTTGNQTIAGDKTFTGVMINATNAPTFSKTPENISGKYLALFEYQGQAVLSMRAIAGVSNTVAIFDLRNGSATCGVITHGLTTDRYIAPGDIIVCTNDASNKKWTVYVKYPQNRRLMIFIDTINSLFGNITLNPGQITSVFTGTLIDNPTSNYTEVVTGIPFEQMS